MRVEGLLGSSKGDEFDTKSCSCFKGRGVVGGKDLRDLCVLLSAHMIV
jgi:hypothetical protein